MRKALIIFAAMVLGATVSRAQIYLGGSIGISSDSNKPDVGEKTTTTNWNVNPTIGYYLNDRFDIGLEFIVYKNKYNLSRNYSFAYKEWRVAPFARYSFFRIGKFEAIAKLAGHVGRRKAESEYPDGTTTESMYTLWGVNLSPELAYSITDHVVIYTTSNFASIGYRSVKGDSGSNYTSFGLGANADNVVNTDNLRLGFIYKF